MRYKLIGCVLALVFLLSSSVQAQKIDDRPALRLTVNQIPLGETDRKVTLYREMLRGSIVVQGSLGQVRPQGEVVVSIDGKDNWQQVQVDGKGVFTFRFRPKTPQDYYLYVGVRDAAGKVSVLHPAGYQLAVTDTSVAEAVKGTLDNMIEAYRDRHASRFMQYVRPGFIGDDILLHRAIRRDFSRFDLVGVRWSLEHFALGDQGRIAVTVHFRRSVISAGTGSFLHDKGTTMLEFRAGPDGPQLYNMKAPLLFGLSDAAYLASGIVTAGENAAGSFIVIDQHGAVVLGPLSATAGG